jgi:predicted nucleotide-binding protein (sugar kinase/HSP70/actin superfamily)
LKKRIGIPRALFYYQYFPLWNVFFQELGGEVVLSKPTNKGIFDKGINVCNDQACIPIKVFHGHVIDLKDKVDFLLIPRFTSISKNEYICPKFGGLPDMIRSTISDLPEIIDVEVNLRKSKRNALKAALLTGKYLCDNQKQIKRAFDIAVQSYRDFRTQVKKGILPSDILDKRLALLKKPLQDSKNIAVIGHGYNLYDSYISMNVLNRLREKNINIITVDMIDNHIIRQKTSTLNKEIFWNFGSKAVGGVLHLLERKNLDGIIYIMSFGCGIDSFMCDLIERKIRRNWDIPFTVLVIDEHSGEAGFKTRIEAFIDMVRWKDRRLENNVAGRQL